MLLVKEALHVTGSFTIKESVPIVKEVSVFVLLHVFCETGTCCLPLADCCFAYHKPPLFCWRYVYMLREFVGLF